MTTEIKQYHRDAVQSEKIPQNLNFLETPTSLRILLSKDTVNWLTQLSDSLGAPKELYRKLEHQRLSFQESKQTGKILTPEDEKNHHQHISVTLAQIAANHSITALEKTREVIIAPWPQINAVVVKTSTHCMALKTESFAHFFDILFQDTKGKEDIRQLVLKSLLNNKKAILSSAH